jgi:uncharacterized protein YndB with AHSA1/START domain
MTTVTNSYRVLIKAPREAVFAYVSDLSLHPEWSGAPLSITPLAAGPLAVGKEYLSHGDIPGQKDRPNQLRVTEYQPSTRFTFIAKDPDFGEIPHIFTFNSEAGGTLLERTVTVTLSPIKAFAYRTFIRPLVGKPSMERALAALKTKLEARVV